MVGHPQEVQPTGDLILGDFSKYLIGLRREARLETSIHSGWQTNEMGVRMIVRLAGQPEWKAPVKPRASHHTLCDPCYYWSRAREHSALARLHLQLAKSFG
jgi:hypothetical protein